MVSNCSFQWIRVFLWMAPKTIQRIAKDVPDASQ